MPNITLSKNFSEFIEKQKINFSLEWTKEKIKEIFKSEDFELDILLDCLDTLITLIIYINGMSSEEFKNANHLFHNELLKNNYNELYYHITIVRRNKNIFNVSELQ